ncbi:unnamed protein product [Tetraodon nigroviridis]|uniref:(spotted green pufferfish) hypothetical protein n=1 Tax=Tetraodon nigroviridis TaxID=99883 RepID=Q4SYU0_TETNG|nr:unnamed protein product [Tetraodon nigroviridis]
MARVGRPSRSLIHTGFLLAVVLLPVAASDGKAEAMERLTKLVRSRRNVPVLAVPQFKRLPDFWGWYKYFMDTHNQEGVEDLDRLYMIYLQNKHRSEEGPTFNHYLNHLSEIYKACADSDNPECISESTSKPKAAVVMPAPIKSAASHAGYYYYAPVLEPFLSPEQKNELLRICNPEDVECLQYHLRAAFGYRPALGPAPSYAALNCNPKDPYCMPTLVHKAPTGFYHLVYPRCDPEVDPLCVTNVATPITAKEAPKEQQCNPLFDASCNPLTATKLSGLTKPVLEYPSKDQPAPPAFPLTCDPRENPYCILAAALASRRPAPQLPEHQTREGYDCYVHYDKDCTPVESGPKAKADIVAPAKPFCHPFDPSCNKFSSPAAAEAPKATKEGVVLPHPDCDPEYDYNCRLRRAEPAATVEIAADEPVKEASGPRFEDFLRGVMKQHQ